MDTGLGMFWHVPHQPPQVSEGLAAKAARPLVFSAWIYLPESAGMAIYQLDELLPDIAGSAWVADSAQVIGQVTLEDDASVWFNATLRGDSAPLHIGRGTNIQDGSVLHA